MHFISKDQLTTTKTFLDKFSSTFIAIIIIIIIKQQNFIPLFLFVINLIRLNTIIIEKTFSLTTLKLIFLFVINESNLKNNKCKNVKCLFLFRYCFVFKSKLKLNVSFINQ